MEVRPGLLVTPSVRLARPLDRGAMGEVWLADHLTLGAPVAVKLIAAELRGRQREVLARFQREASAAARIASPHVVRTFDQGFTSTGMPYIVMELLVGETLAARIARAGRLDLAETRAVITQVASALGDAHALGIIHRDIKPENVFLVEDGAGIFVKVLDFGIAKEREAVLSLTATGMVFGTPTYMSPEQLDSTRDVDERTDLWALGVLAYTALTGREPFAGSSTLEVSLAVMKGSFVPPSQHVPDLPGGLDAWFARALALEKAARFASAEEMVDAFVAACDEAKPPPSPNTLEPRSPLAKTVVLVPPAVDTTPPLAAPKITQPLRSSRNPIAALIVVAGLALGALGITLTYWLATPTAPEATAEEPADPRSATTASSTSPVPSSSATADDETTVAVAGGSYWVGCRADRHRVCFDDEKPAFEARVKAFRIMRHEVTVAEYRACVRAEACPPAGRGPGCFAARTDVDRYPINCVDWRSAAAYCAFRGMRLPTEIEWEVAALGEAHRDFPWGSDPPSCTRTVMRGDDECADGPQPVGSRSEDRSWVGAMDMGGNLREWTASDYAPYPGGHVDASDGKVNRGGSFEMGAAQFDTSHTRRVDPPTLARADLGFRCVTIE